MKHTDIKTKEDAYKVLGIDRDKALPDYSGMPEKHQVALTAHADLIVVVEALNFVANEGKEWKPNWSNYNERKYYPYFDLENGLVFIRVDVWYSLTGASSRLCFKSRDLAEYAAKQFKELYERYYLLS
jgi:hypothetical protein